MNGYEGLPRDQLYKIYRRKVEQLIFARENYDLMREKDTLLEMIQLEKLLDPLSKEKKNNFSKFGV